MTSTELKHRGQLQNWAEAVRDCRSSGLSVKQWCKQREITTTTYYRWEREVLALANTEKAKGVEAGVTFVELPAAQAQRKVSERAATFRYGDIYVDIYNEASPELLRSILEAVRSC
jgi:hypothetical protein